MLPTSEQHFYSFVCVIFFIKRTAAAPPLQVTLAMCVIARNEAIPN